MDLKSYNSLNTSCRCSEMHHQWCTVSWGHRVFQDFWNIRHPRRGDPAGGDQFLGCILARDDDWASLFSQSHLVALSAASVTDLMTLFLAKPTIPSLARTLQSDLPTKPQRSTSIGSQWVIQPCPLHCFISFWYLASYALVPCQCTPSRAW